MNLKTSDTPRNILFNIKRILVTILMVEIAILISLNPSKGALATGNNSPSECDDPDAKVEDNEDLMTYTAPSGNTITGVCIKSGDNMFGGNEHSGLLGDGTYENGCYTISGVNTDTVTVERTGTDSNTCQGLSHIDIFFSPSPTASPTGTPTPTPTPTSTPTPTPTPSLTPTPTPTPSPCNGICNNTGGVPTPTPTPSPTPTPETSPTPSPTPTPETSPTPSPTPTPTATPTPAPTTASPTPTSSPTTITTTTTGEGGTAVAGASAESTPTPSPTPTSAVLGASAQLPETGTPPHWFYFGLFTLLSGAGLTISGLRKNT